MIGESMPAGDCHGEQVIVRDEDVLTALIDQMQRNWDRGDNAANDDLVVQIREHIRRQRVTDSSELGRTAVSDTTRARYKQSQERDENIPVPRPMPEHAQTVADDLGYWSEHGVHVVSVRPRVDGSGAVIGVHHLTNHIATAMQERYAFPVYCWDSPAPH